MVGSNRLKSAFVNGDMGGRSLAWLGHRLPKPTTRVQIPVTAPRFPHTPSYDRILEKGVSEILEVR